MLEAIRLVGRNVGYGGISLSKIRGPGTMLRV